MKVRVPVAVADHLIAIHGGARRITPKLVQVDQVAHGHLIVPIHPQSLQVGRLGVGGVPDPQEQRAEVGPRRRELTIVLVDGLAEVRESGRGVARLHALDAQVVEEVGQRARVGDRAPVVAGPEVTDVEVHGLRCPQRPGPPSR